MKFSNVLQLSALAVAISSGAVSAKEEPHLLRGGPVVASDVVVKAGKSSSSKSGSSSRSSSSKSSKDFAAANIAVASSKSSKDSSSRSSSSSKSSKDFASVIESKDVDVEIPEFFPSEMTEEQLASFIEERKEKAARKRQNKRDARRAEDNPDRRQDEEDKERARKTKQSERRGNPHSDPYYDSNSSSAERYAAGREAKRLARCERDNRNCNYSGPNSRCYNECVGTGSKKKANEICARKCRYIEVGCYNDCRIYDRATVCINDCEVNVKDNKVKTYNGSQHCLDECDHINNKNAREHCYEDCYSTSYDKEE